ncbi:DUF6518 family protein [Streptomyces sp. NRRL WC-3549]|uniref:DUF6518 family protein n=1 Tax=Streptomyces sp. NRRL WC-3549 TaxID=1463925 RepID=UPI00131AA3A8|nr:DUF6518 family protein [Streptomyces sp. NRRL WC-3549]
MFLSRYISHCGRFGRRDLWSALGIGKRAREPCGKYHSCRRLDVRASSFVAGFLTGSKKRAAIMGFISLIVTVFAYYLTKATQGDFVASDYSDPTAQATVFAWGDFLSMLILWCAFALAAGPIFGIVGHLAHVGPHGLASRLLIPMVVIGETTVRLSAEANLQEALVGATWSVTRALAVAVALALLCVAAVKARRRQSARA